MAMNQLHKLVGSSRRSQYLPLSGVSTPATSPPRRSGSPDFSSEKSHNSSSSSSNGSSSFSSSTSSMPSPSRLFMQQLPPREYFQQQLSSIWSIKRLAFLLTQVVLVGFAVYGMKMLFTIKNNDWMIVRANEWFRMDSHSWMRVPVYTQYEIAQAGWNRPQIELSSTVGETASTTKQQAKPKAGQGYPTTLQIHDFEAPNSNPTTPDEQHILILTPLKNAVHALPGFWKLIASLEHPKENTSLGFLIGDEEDETSRVVHEWVEEMTKKRQYRRITLLNKNIGLVMPPGEARHEEWVQGQRRQSMAKARTLLLTATLEPSVDWVLWLDSDLDEAPPSLIADLMYYGNAGTTPAPELPKGSKERLADVICPNVVVKKHNTVETYDMNSWAETPESLEMKVKLATNRILYEGYEDKLPTYRKHLTRQWVRPNTSSTWDYLSPLYPYNASKEGPSNLYDPESDAYIGARLDLDAVGGVCTLVRSYVHRFGAVFPAWIEDHQVETEGFGVMAKQLVGARIVGLPNYLTYHLSPEKHVHQTG